MPSSARCFLGWKGSINRQQKASLSEGGGLGVSRGRRAWFQETPPVSFADSPLWEGAYFVPYHAVVGALHEAPASHRG